jgi:hypothetical protein
MTAALMVLVPAASARATAFDGSCKLRATVHFTPAINFLPQQVRYTVTDGGSADGFSIESRGGFAPWRSTTCTGTLNGRPYSGAVSLTVKGAGLLACDVGNLDGRGKLTFLATGKRGRHPSLGFRLTTPFVLRFPLFVVSGDRGGRATGTTQFWTTKNPAGITNCFAHGKLTPTTVATTPSDGVPSAMFEAPIQGARGGIAG